MKNDKSIDGLVTRSAKKTALSKTTKKTTRKPLSAPQNTQKLHSKKPKSITVNDISPKSTEIKPTPTVTISKKPTPSSSADFLSPVQAFNFTEDGKLTESAETVKDMKESTKKSPSEDKNLSKKQLKKLAREDAKKAKKAEKAAKKKPGKVRKTITIIALIIVLAAIGLVIWAVFWGNDIIAKITGGQGNILDLFTLTDENYEPLKTDSNGRTNILAFGTSGYNMQGDEGNGTHDGAQLTDSIMLISVNQETGDVAMLSLPRDLKASPTCTATGKINEVYWCNNMYDEDEAAGATALMTEVGNILGVDIQYYAHLNWGSLVSIVDILGGIKVTLDEDIHDYYFTEAVFDAGVEYEINGAQALGLARARHGTAGGDFSRGASQQKILIGIKNKIFEKNLSLTDLLGLASTLGDNLRTNFSVSELKTLAHLSFVFDLDSMRQISLLDPGSGINLMTTGTINGISYVLPSAGAGNYGKIQAYVTEQLSNDPRVYEEPSILVLNASEVVGVASDERAKLTADGYTNITADNAPEGEYQTGTTLYVINNKPGTKSLLESFYGTSAEPSDSLPTNVSRDYDFVIILNPSDDANQ